MSVVRVGVKRITKNAGFEVDKIGDPGVELFQEWVEIDGKRIGDGSLMGVRYGTLRDIDPLATGRESGEYQNAVVIVLLSDSFSSVDHREPPDA